MDAAFFYQKSFDVLKCYSSEVKLGHGVFKRSLTTPISVLLCCQQACVYSQVSATFSAIYHQYTQTSVLQETCNPVKEDANFLMSA